MALVNNFGPKSARRRIDPVALLTKREMRVVLSLLQGQERHIRNDILQPDAFEWLNQRREVKRADEIRDIRRKLREARKKGAEK